MRRLILGSAMPVASLILACCCSNANAQTQLPVEIQQKIDKVAHRRARQDGRAQRLRCGRKGWADRVSARLRECAARA